MSVTPDRRRLAPLVWRVDLKVAGPSLLALEEETPRLAEEDRHRASRFADVARQREWLAAHIALRLVIEQAGGSGGRGAVFSRSESGRPFLPNSGFDFSLSHAAQHALIGITDFAPIGVDLEGPREIHMEASRQAAIEAAGAAIAQEPLPAASDAGRFLQAWVRLEALAKAEGTGMARVLSKAGAFGPRRGLGVDAKILPDGLRVMDLALGPGLYGAVAVASASDRPELGVMPVDLDGLRRFPARRPG